MSALNGEVILADQGLGAPLQLRIFGDEFYSRRETLQGYTVVYDSEKHCYCYATLAVGRFLSSGVPAYKPVPIGLSKHLKEDPQVRNEKFGLRYRRLRPVESDPQTGLTRTFGADGGLLTGRKLHAGQVKGLTILVDFDDIRTNIAKDDVDAMFNADNYTENGNYCSVKSYFETVSSGKLQYTNLVVGPVRLSKRRSFYINNLLVKEALDIAVNQLGVDLSQFDSRQEGIVDAINFLYAGNSQYDGNLWPHNSFASLQYGPMRTHYYQLTGLGQHKVDLRIGTICHENGHLLCRFPDMYDYGKRDGDHETSQGIGSYCLMGSGNHLNERRTPAPVCGYLRDLAGWVEEMVDLNNPGNFQAEHGQYQQVMKYRTDQLNEYFLVENRTRLGLDSYLPASGLAVLHCDTLGSNEWQGGTRNNHYQCALLQADGHLDLENNRNRGDEGDLYKFHPGVALSDTTVPSSREWDGTDSGLLIRDIAPPAEVIGFSVGQAATPNSLQMETWPDLVIPDNQPSGLSSSLTVAANGQLSALAVSVDIIHSWISDLSVELRSPAGTVVLLHDRAGNDGDDIKKTWFSSDFTDLQVFYGEEVKGDWTLHIVDQASADVGRLLSWGLQLQVEATAGGTLEERLEPQLDIPDASPAGISSLLRLSQSGQVKEIEVAVEIEHSYIGDLQVDLVAPSGLIVQLHNQSGDWQDNLQRTYDTTSTPLLEGVIGESIAGDWQLRVRDLAPIDQGRLTAWSLKIGF